MSKPIINGIDVSECAYFNSVTYEEPYCNIDQERLYTCSSDENCYYKQLKRLQQQIEAYQLSENEAKEIIAELKHKNKELQKENKSLQMLSCANCGEKYLSPDGAELYDENVQLQKENEELKANKGRCAFKCLDNTFCDEAKFKIDKLELDKDCLNASLETARKYRGIAEADRDKYKQALEEIRGFISPTYFDCKNCKELKKPFAQQNCNGFKYEAILNKIDEVLNER